MVDVLRLNFLSRLVDELWEKEAKLEAKRENLRSHYLVEILSKMGAWIQHILQSIFLEHTIRFHLKIICKIPPMISCNKIMLELQCLFLGFTHFN